MKPILFFLLVFWATAGGNVLIAMLQREKKKLLAMERGAITRLTYSAQAFSRCYRFRVLAALLKGLKLGRDGVGFSALALGCSILGCNV